MLSAEKCAESLDLSIKFYCSNLFQNVQKRFDIIAFNAPYLDFDKGKKLGILKDRLSEIRFSGGKDGCETIIRFLQDAQDYLSDTGVLLLGVCHYHITQDSVQQLISSSGFELRERVTYGCIPSAVYVLCKKNKKQGDRI